MTTSENTLGQAAKENSGAKPRVFQKLSLSFWQGAAFGMALSAFLAALVEIID